MSLAATKLNSSFELQGLGYSNGDHAAWLSRHRWYPIKEAFSPGLVERLIWHSRCKPDSLIVDPFAGSGTVPLVAAHLGMRSVGMEVNPFLGFVARAKLRQASPLAFDRVLKRVVRASTHGKVSSLERYSTFGSRSGADKWLFNTSVLRAFEAGWAESDDASVEVKDIMRLCLIRAAMACCNAKRDGKCFRYWSDWRSRKYGVREFQSKLLAYGTMVGCDLAGGRVFSGRGEIIAGDAREDLKAGIKRKFSLCITSPPYLNSFDYSDIYRPEMFLGKFISGSNELKLLRHKTLRSHVQVNWRRPHDEAFGERYASTMRAFRRQTHGFWDYRIPLMIQAYFEDLKVILKSLLQLASKDAQLWLVVATSAYAGVHVPVDEIIGEIGDSAGWELDQIGVLRELRAAGQHWQRARKRSKRTTLLRESVVVFHNGK